MKIKTVKVPIVERYDGAESTGSDTCDSSGNMHVSQANTGMVSHGTDVSLSPAMIAHYEKTMGMFAVAMTELQMELRDKTNECEALYETARSLSQALQESDLLLQNKTLECERLSLKMQMVTFVELNDDADPFGCCQDTVDFDSSDFCDTDDYCAIPKHPAAILDQMPAIRRLPEGSTRLPVSNAKNCRETGLGSKTSVSRESRVSFGPVCVDDCDDDDDTEYSACIKKSEMVAIKVKSPVCVDDVSVASDDFHQTSRRTVNDGTVQVISGPSQAHFYHIILERDMAKQTNSKLTRELRYARSKLRELKSKLDQSKSLLELAYDSSKSRKHNERQGLSAVPNSRRSTKICKSDVDNESKATERHEDNAFSNARRRSLPWRRNYGIGSTLEINRDKHHLLSGTEYLFFDTNQEMLIKNWNNASAKAMDATSTENNLGVLLNPEDDADRAGGCGEPSSS